MRFGDRLKNERNKNNLTQDVVAKKLMVSRQTISNWENEKSYPGIDSLIRISDLYNISLDVLLKEDTGMKEYLKKEEVKKYTTPISCFLTIIDISFLIYLLLTLFDLIKVNSGISLFIFVLGMLNIVALIILNKFRFKVNDKKCTIKKAASNFNWDFINCIKYCIVLVKGHICWDIICYFRKYHYIFTISI